MQIKHRISAFILAILLALPFIPAPVASAAEAVAYVKDGGSDSYAGTLSKPYATLKKAIDAVSPTGGTVVVCGPTTVSSGIIPNAHTAKVTVTSLYNGTDYAKTANARIIFRANIAMRGPMEFNNVTLASSVKSGATDMYSYFAIKPSGYELILGDGINSTLDGGCETYLSIVAGAGDQKITVNSGHWQRVRVNDAAGTASAPTSVTLTVNGGTFHEKLILTGEKSARYTNVTATVNGGEFLGGIYLVAFEKNGSFGASPKFTGNVSITVNGGRIYGPLSVSYRRLGSFYGNYTLNLNGGELHSITEICGPSAVGGTMTGILNFGPDINASAKIKGSETFDFCLRDAADPYVFYHDGMYYLTSTGGTSIGLACAANLSDLGSAAKTVIFHAPSGYKNAWSPEIHYFTDEEIGAGNGGWYMFLSLSQTDDTNFAGQREYVMKCLDGDYLLGRWGDPVTGEVNKPRYISFTGSFDYNATFCAGMSIMRLNGNVYMTFISEVGRDSLDFYQTVCIVEFDNPWTISEEVSVICEPTYSWEAHGSGLGGDGVYRPKVVEGCSPVYGEDGSVYLMYTGSGYWTTWYALGYMKYTGGDPLEASSWQKNPTPILQRKSTLTANTVNGCGHGSYFTDENGKMWVCYHGYIGTNTASGRFAFLEPIYVSESGVSIGGAGINPPDKGATQTEPLNSLSLEKRAVGFARIDQAPRFQSASLTLENNISISFKAKNVNSALYSNIRATFEMNGRTTEVAEGTLDGNVLVFKFRNVSPALMTETVTATLYATFDGTEYELDKRDYSIATYCYNQLANTTQDDAEFRTLLVDLLNYGTEAQLYVGKNTDELANAKLTEEQKAFATQSLPQLESCFALTDAPQTVKAKFSSASLLLNDSINVQFKLSAESVEGLSAKITMGSNIYTVNSDSFKYADGVYTVSFKNLFATQLSDLISVTVYEGSNPVSKTLTYSVESYAAKMQDGLAHSNLVVALMKYGNAAKAYAGR